ncbi:MAG: ABC transporter ATP-binding protein [Crocinitomicaceae bacterium]|nr:ABC transporter ATP-binding protein [Crocinitomicaceae bacterium]MBK8925252.1 ABC transporter ATP-binding protein [Crocinitomicaceae bacterium]
MSEIILDVEGVSKQYRLGQSGTGTISHDLNRYWHRLRGKEDPYLNVTEANVREQKSVNPYVWAVKDISFQLKEGEVMGVVGKNGAGKSTLLKLLSRITGPTTGTIRMKGRISSLLEVGTGFHPELTGRENIFLNGAILGMKRFEIQMKLDEIVAFSGCANYLDTPVKRYSSGMIVRLGFAVAAHLESEILVVDEVLAVGDQEFQKKCIGKMQDISKGGRAVLFVSHNLSTLLNLCQSGILLKNGELVYKGTIQDTIGKYLQGTNFEKNTKFDLTNFTEREGTGELKFISIEFCNPNNSQNTFLIGDNLEMNIELESRILKKVRFAIYIYRYDETLLSNIENMDSDFEIIPFVGKKKLSVTFRDIRFYPGEYKVGLWIGDALSSQHIDLLRFCANFSVEDGSNIVKRSLPQRSGVIFLNPEWKEVKK